MSFKNMIKTLNMENHDSFAHNETLEHPAYIHEITGIDPFEEPEKAMLAAARKLDFDWLYSIPKKAHRFETGENKKHIGGGTYVTEWGFTGSAWSDYEKYTDTEQIYTYDPFANHESEEHIRKIARMKFDSSIQDQKLIGDGAVISGLYYTTLFQWFIMVFGWEMFLVAAAENPKRFELCIDRFKRYSSIYVEEYAKSEIPFLFCHDDLAITRGLVFAPEWYRKYIFPAYEEIFEPVKKEGKKIIFVSDGNYIELLDDLFTLGIDGIIVDWTFDLAEIFKRYGKTKVIVGNADTVILTYGTTEDVRKEVHRCVDAAKGSSGFVMKCSNDLPQNIPIENMRVYFNTISELKNR